MTRTNLDSDESRFRARGQQPDFGGDRTVEVAAQRGDDSLEELRFVKQPSACCHWHAMYRRNIEHSRTHPTRTVMAAPRNLLWAAQIDVDRIAPVLHMLRRGE